MKVVILAGGLGTRLSEETSLRPKPMVEVGGKPILDHIMRWYVKFGYNEFVLALGYKGEHIKQHFLNYYAYNSDITISLKDGRTTLSKSIAELDDWVVHLVDTGLHTLTAGRIARLKKYLEGDDMFMLTYGDGLSNVNIGELLAFHRAHEKLVTVTAVYPPSRFGGLALNGDKVDSFVEKPKMGEGMISGGFFVVNREVLDMLEPDSPMWEQFPLPELAARGELMAYRHTGFWQAMDNIREKQMLEELWASDKAPWKA